MVRILAFKIVHVYCMTSNHFVSAVLFVLGSTAYQETATVSHVALVKFCLIALGSMTDTHINPCLLKLSAGSQQQFASAKTFGSGDLGIWPIDSVSTSRTHHCDTH